MTLEPQQFLTMYRQMATIRAFDNRAVEEFHAGNIPGVVHTYLGQEAIAVGVCTALRRDDKIVSTHRGHGHTIAKGAGLERMMAELFGRSTGYCKGKGGSMHIADFTVGMLGANGIVGTAGRLLSLPRGHHREHPNPGIHIRSRVERPMQ